MDWMCVSVCVSLKFVLLSLEEGLVAFFFCVVHTQHGSANCEEQHIAIKNRNYSLGRS